MCGEDTQQMGHEMLLAQALEQLLYFMPAAKRLQTYTHTLSSVLTFYANSPSFGLCALKLDDVSETD